jgi:ArsR family metal-binding transcriptional regulator
MTPAPPDLEIEITNVMPCLADPEKIRFRSRVGEDISAHRGRIPARRSGGAKFW